MKMMMMILEMKNPDVSLLCRTATITLTVTHSNTKFFKFKICAGGQEAPGNVSSVFSSEHMFCYVALVLRCSLMHLALWLS